MVSPLFFSQLVLIARVWLFLVLHSAWPRERAKRPPPAAREPRKSKRTRSQAPKPFAGLTQRPHGVLWEREAAHPQPPPPLPPAPRLPTNRRPRTVDPARPCCPQAGGRYRGGLGLGNVRANGPPSGGPGRPCQGISCDGSCLATHGTLVHGQQASVELSGRVLACLAEGLGIRATARVFEMAPNTVLPWRVAAAEHLKACTRDVLGDRPLTQWPLDELSAVLRGVQEGESSAQQAIKRLERSRHWGWTASDPESTRLWVSESRPRPLA